MKDVKNRLAPDSTWQKMFQAAKKVQGFHEISDHMEAGGVAAAVLSESGKIYTGVCVDTACTLGVCAERNALFNMITNGETKISRVLALMSNGKNGAPCGACREFMVQMMEKDYQNVEVMMDYESNKVMTLGELTPEWWLLFGGIEMSEKPFILDFDSNEHAVLEPNHDKLPFKFHEKLVYAFVPKEDIDNFLKQVPHKILGNFDTVSFQPNIYEIEINGEKLTLCQAPLGAPAATQLLDWLIAYGVKQVLAFGNAGALIDLPENEMFLPVRAIRGEGTSFYYQEPGQFIDMKSDYLNEIEKIITDMKLDCDEITTWTTDGFFRETPDRVKQFRELGAATVEMECAGMAACAQFRNVDFAQILFTADTLADIENYDERDWGSDSHSAGLKICSQILSRM